VVIAEVKEEVCVEVLSLLSRGVELRRNWSRLCSANSPRYLSMLATVIDRGRDVWDEARFLTLVWSMFDDTERLLSALDLERVDEGLK